MVVIVIFNSSATDRSKVVPLLHFFFVCMLVLSFVALVLLVPHLSVWCPGKAVLCDCITKTYLYNFDPLKPHFYIVKLGFTGVYIVFLISAQKHRLWLLVRTALATIYVLSRNVKNIRIFHLETFQFFCGEIFNIFE